MAPRVSRERAKRERKRRLAELLERGTRDHYLDPLLYDFEYGEQISDVEWYRSLARQRAQGLPILELGAGSGRSCFGGGLPRETPAWSACGKTKRTARPWGSSSTGGTS